MEAHGARHDVHHSTSWKHGILDRPFKSCKCKACAPEKGSFCYNCGGAGCPPAPLSLELEEDGGRSPYSGMWEIRKKLREMDRAEGLEVGEETEWD
jgi:hypothetical protein